MTPEFPAVAGDAGDPLTATGGRLGAQLRFLLEIDRVKHVVRHNPLADGSRRENDAEHMWHLTVLAIVLAEHADEPVDLARVLTMVALHDVVEIDTGDVLVYDAEARRAAAAAEREAAGRIFGLLPTDQAAALRSLWAEFEARQSPDARFAAAIDRLQPLLLNLAAGGGAWTTAGVTAARVRTANAHMAAGSARLWELAQEVIATAETAGMLAGST
ncbi:MAG TPA: HD domain-containing protein [Acidimicrobiales bacterium]|nr:HD domain-containing protein [Acidimicrobiales bacterium]